MIIVDRFSKAPLLQEMSEITAKAIIKRLYETFYPYYGISRAIINNRGIQFVSRIWRYFCKLLKIKQRLFTAYHAQTDGQTERIN
jgi:hypothetical protein